ncbi:hypothetical protein PPL_11741 [Heterostelium album PN500]|uniref:Uncharacterized protein n=1 Tax=Heterostelium pallidum (strain ATCC 26659 / Pp 5 / PN500) TaxID=670386 RepID=D3BUC2_HETP5|nr:hypothetical protein PPL_11741 [Heterostelium album PN500]EFA74710.1 hypothetical protein PPL_11741 [Heterostelium album PN500]|eukprot:XP_020426844.1 hypothetical protein PPL_11741 [Heterostelium album PN500]
MENNKDLNNNQNSKVIPKKIPRWTSQVNYYPPLFKEYDTSKSDGNINSNNSSCPNQINNSNPNINKNNNYIMNRKYNELEANIDYTLRGTCIETSVKYNNTIRVKALQMLQEKDVTSTTQRFAMSTSTSSNSTANIHYHINIVSTPKN